MHSEQLSATTKTDTTEIHIHAYTTSLYKPAGLSLPKKIEKRWGHELVFFNEDYCIKQLHINHGQSTSMHFHIEKHETLYVSQGELVLEYKDGKGGDYVTVIPAGSAFVVPPGFQHKLSSRDGLVILIEASTHDDPNDSIRVHM